MAIGTLPQQPGRKGRQGNRKPGEALRRAQVRARPGTSTPGTRQDVGSRSIWAPPDLGCSCHCPVLPQLAHRDPVPLQVQALSNLHSHRSSCWFSGPHAFHMAANPSFSLAEAKELRRDLCLESDSPRTRHLCVQQASLQMETDEG